MYIYARLKKLLKLGNNIRKNTHEIVVAKMLVLLI